MEQVHYFGGWVEGASKQTGRTDGGWVQSTFSAKAAKNPVFTSIFDYCMANTYFQGLTFASLSLRFDDSTQGISLKNQM